MDVKPDSVVKPPARSFTRAAVAALLVVLLLALSAMGFAVISSLASPAIDAPQPLLYVSGGTAYMACGSHTVRLDNASVISDSGNLNGEFSADNSWLFYIANHDKTTGEGDLMRVATDGRHSPKRVAQGVSNAVFSNDGSRLLYTRQSGDLYALRIGQGQPQLLAHGVIDFALSGNGERALYICGTQDMGDLYSWDFSADPEFIAHNVCSKYYEFSPNTKDICYVVKSVAGGGMAQTATGTTPAGDTYTLYVKYGSDTPESVDQNTTGADDFFGFSLHLLDDGQLLYFGEDTLIGSPFHIFSPYNVTETYPPYSMVFTVFSDNSFLFRSEGSMYYKAPGQAAELLSDNMYLFPFFSRPFTVVSPDAEKRFLLMEGDTAWNEDMPQYATVYEQEIGKPKLKLCMADAVPLSVNFNSDLTKLAYVRDGALYMMQKENGSWSEPITVSGDGYAEIHLYENAFDSTEQYLYYLKKADEDAQYSDLYRYSLAQDESTLLLQNVRIFDLIDDVPYAITTENDLFRMDTGKQLAQDVRYIREAEDGIHIIVEQGVRYYGEGVRTPVMLFSEEIEVISFAGITVLPPLTDEIAAKLEELCADAQYCISVLESGGTGSYLDEYIAAKELNAREEVPPELHSILSDFLAGFANANSYSICINEQVKLDQAEHYRNEAIKLLQSALQSCREYLGDTGMR